MMMKKINMNEREMSCSSIDPNKPIDDSSPTVHWAVDEEDDDILDDDEEIDDNTGEFPVRYVQANELTLVLFLCTNPLFLNRITLSRHLYRSIYYITLRPSRRRQGRHGAVGDDGGPHLEAAATFVAGVLPPDPALEREEVRALLLDLPCVCVLT
jgi:hypothetical protein